MGIRGQLLLLVPTLVALALALSTVTEMRREREEALDDFRLRNEKALEAIGVTVAVQIAQNELGTLDTFVAHLSDSMRRRDLIELSVLDESGRVLAHTEPERFNTHPRDPFSLQAVQADGPVSEVHGDEFWQAVPATSGLRWGTVIARFRLERLEAQITRTRNRLAGVSAAIFVLLVVLLFFGIDRLVVRPLLVLQHAVRRMGEGHLSTRVPRLRGAELGELGEVVNRMAAALQHEREHLERAVDARTRELQELNVRLERLAVTDGLTGVFNHRRFQEQLQAEILRAERHRRALSVLMIDVDNFKKVNDALGHPAGDELLRRLAGVLSADLRQTDFIARYGGEEFTVLLPETTKTEAMQAAERMRLAVEAKINTPGEKWPGPVTVSIGVATLSEDGATGEGVVTAADQAMYVAKRQGRNRVVGARTVAT